MAIANGSQTMGLVNSAGDLTYYKRNGKTISKKKIQANSSRTPAQMLQRSCFKLAGHLSKRFYEVIMKGFASTKYVSSAFNSFVRLNIQHITATYDEKSEKYIASIDYTRLQCADGDLFPPELTATIEQENAKIVVTVNEPIPGGRYNPDDKIYLVIYEKVQELCLMHELCARTEVGDVEILIPQRWDTEAMELYAFASSNKGKMSSPSIYLKH